jgi:hypothetical protein
MMATEAAKLRSKTGGYQQRQDTDTKISSETSANDDTTTSRDNIVRQYSLISNNDNVPVTERKSSSSSSKVQRLYYDEKYGNTDCTIRDHYYSPYYVHLPPNRGGEILFRE